jgi:hypothetical protein
MKTTIKIITIAICLAFVSSFTNSPKIKFAKKLSVYCKTLPDDFDKISEERKKDIIEMGDYIIEKRSENKNAIFFLFARAIHGEAIWRKYGLIPPHCIMV